MIATRNDTEDNRDRCTPADVDLSWLEVESYEKMPKRKDAPSPTHVNTTRNRGWHRVWATYRFRRAQRAVGGLCQRGRRRHKSAMW